MWKAQPMNHEEEFIKRFVTPQKRRRYLAFLEASKGRKKLLDEFDHFQDLDSRYAKLVPANLQTVHDLESLLKKQGAPDRCHVMSSNPNIDNRECDLHEALKETVGGGSGTVLSCIPGKL